MACQSSHCSGSVKECLVFCSEVQALGLGSNRDQKARLPLVKVVPVLLASAAGGALADWMGCGMERPMLPSGALSLFHYHFFKR